MSELSDRANEIDTGIKRGDIYDVTCPKCKAEFKTEYYEDRPVTCPKCDYEFCGKPTEVYTRVVGYHRPLKNFNKGKKQEFKDRKNFSVNKLGS